MMDCSPTAPDNAGQVKDKERKARTAPTNTSLLPPCKVCQEPAAGFHYGANTCEACKGFFRRSLLRNEPYRCLGMGNCNIRAGKRKICPKCRHFKCLAVGMSREAIKTGRYTHAKRTQDILEYHQMMGKALSDIHVVAASKSNIITTSTNTLKSLTSNSLPADTSPELCDSTQLLSLSPVASAQVGCEILDSASVLDGPFQLSAPISPSSFSYDVMVDLKRCGDDMSQSAGVAASSVLCEKGGVESAQPSPDSSQTSDKANGLLSDAECQRIVNNLLQSHRELMVTFNDSLTPEKLLEEQTACYEACRLKVEMFGIMRLSDEEYQDIYQKTGLDADNRQGIITEAVRSMEEGIRRAISFIKTIPGFTDLPIKDQIRLIRDNRSEFRIISTYHGFNNQLKVMTDQNGSTLCIHELGKMWSEEELHHRFQCAQDLQKLGLSQQETIILKCMMIVTVGNTDLEEAEKVSAIQWTMAQCLLWLLKQTRPNPDRVFARIISCVCHLRVLCNSFYKWLKTDPYKHYSQVQSNAFLREWFSDS